MVLIAPILVLGLPIFDTLFAIVRRIKKGKSLKAIFEADNGHLHHRLMKRGYTQKQAVAILYATSASLGMFAIILIDDGIGKAISFLILISLIVVFGFKELKKFNEEIIAENQPTEKINASQKEEKTKPKVKEVKKSKKNKNKK